MIQIKPKKPNAPINIRKFDERGKEILHIPNMDAKDNDSRFEDICTAGLKILQQKSKAESLSKDEQSYLKILMEVANYLKGGATITITNKMDNLTNEQLVETLRKYTEDNK